MDLFSGLGAPAGHRVRRPAQLLRGHLTSSWNGKRRAIQPAPEVAHRASRDPTSRFCHYCVGCSDACITAQVSTANELGRASEPVVLTGPTRRRSRALTPADLLRRWAGRTEPRAGRTEPGAGSPQRHEAPGGARSNDWTSPSAFCYPHCLESEGRP